MPESCLIYLVRHGATHHNLLDPPRMQGRHIDEPLAELGQSQAAQAATQLAGKSIAAVYVSPLRRAMQTAEAIAAEHQLAPLAVGDLVEADVGRWEDRSWDEIELNDRAAYHAFRKDPAANGYPEGENLQAVTDRVKRAIHGVAGDHMGQQVVVVAHSVVNRLYLGELLGVPIALRRRMPQDNCGINLIAWRPDKQHVVTVNGVSHLAP